MPLLFRLLYRNDTGSLASVWQPRRVVTLESRQLWVQSQTQLAQYAIALEKQFKT